MTKFEKWFEKHHIDPSYYYIVDANETCTVWAGRKMDMYSIMIPHSDLKDLA